MSSRQAPVRNPLINPPKTGRWIIVSESDPHRIDVYDNGTLVRRIASFSTGGKWKGKWHHTPTGKFHVHFRDKDHISSLYHAPMPYYVNFATSVGFHGGNPARVSHGCVHLTPDDARWVFEWSDPASHFVHVWVMPRKAH